MSRRRPSLRLTALLALVLGISGALAVFYGTQLYGPGLSNDSLIYCSVARQFAAGNGYVQYNGYMFVQWPPLYPALLGSLTLGLGVDVYDAARAVSAVSFALVIMLAALASARWLRSTLVLPLLVGLWTLFGVPTYDLAVMALSEGPFLVMLLAALIALVAYLDSARREWMLVAAVCAGFGTLTRYMGVTVVGTGVLVIGLYGPGTRRERIRTAARFGLIASVLPVIWLIRNWSVSRTLAGERYPATDSLADNLRYVFSTLFDWFLPGQIAPAANLTVLLGVGMLAALIMFGAWLARRGQTVPSWAPARVLGLFVAIYVVTLIAASSRVAYERIADRLLLPIYVPLVVLLLAVAKLALTQIPAQHRRRAVFVLALLAALWTLYPVLHTLDAMRDKATHGAGGYSTDVWREGGTFRYLARESRHDLSGDTGHAIYSNRPYLVHGLLGIDAIASPSKVYYRSTRTLHAWDDVRATWPATNPAFLIWFDRNSPYRYTLEDLASIAQLSLVADLDDGAIYEVRRHE